MAREAIHTDFIPNLRPSRRVASAGGFGGGSGNGGDEVPPPDISEYDLRVRLSQREEGVPENVTMLPFQQ